jgi:transmembrane sensor
MSDEASNRLYEMAAAWHGRMNDEDVSPSVRAEFEAWLVENPEHTAAYQTVERAWQQMAEVGNDPRVLALRREALTARGRVRWSRIAAAAVVGVALLGAIYYSGPVIDGVRLATFAGDTQQGTFSTAIGEQSSATLPDGSTIVLNTDSRVSVVFTPQQRQVRLLRGQVWFQVARSSERPFIVDAGDRRITAVGTAFDVRLDDRKASVQVTLAEGRVRVARRESMLNRLIGRAEPVAELQPGEALLVSPRAPATTQVVDPLSVSLWRSGQIVFDDATLDHAVEEVNRYSKKQIVLADDALRGLRVSGVFKTGSSQSFVETVTAHYPIEIAEASEARIVLAGKPAGK